LAVPIRFLIACLGLAWNTSYMGLRADDAVTSAARADPDPRGAFVDDAFDGFVSLERIESAVTSDDAAALTDVALLVAHGEAVLQRARNGVNADQLVRAAVEAAATAQDQQTLQRLERGLACLQRDDLQEVLATAQQLGASARKLETPPGLDPSEVTVESMVLYHAMAKEIQKAQRYGMAGDVEDIVASLKHLPLHKKQRDHLAKLANLALVAIRDQSPDDSTLGKLAMATRSVAVTNSVRLISAPTSISHGGSAECLVVLQRPAAADTTVHVSARQLSTVSSVTVPAGEVSAAFTIAVPATSVAGDARITANVNDGVCVLRSIRFAE
jgi:hypothetical protein